MSTARVDIVPNSEDELVAYLRELSATAAVDTPRCRIVGSGSWLNGGAPVRATARLHTRQLRGVVEYVPGDLVLTVGAGTTLAEIAEITAAHDQWLALDPFLSAPHSEDAGDADQPSPSGSAIEAAGSATIGATIATASQGPLALGFGRPRDLVLGMSVITGDGTRIRAGGRVVKNVAGFDLVRLNTGAWGSLGVITQVSMRLHARPAIDETVAIDVLLPTDSAARYAVIERLAVQLNSAPLLATTSSLAALVMLVGDDRAQILARLQGNAARVRAQRAALSTVGDLAVHPTHVWSRVRTTLRGTVVVRAVDAPSRAADMLKNVEEWLERVHSTNSTVIVEPMRGAIRVACTPSESATAAPTTVLLPPRAIAEQLPRVWWAQCAPVADDALSQQLRRRCDPAGLLNPGIVGPAVPQHAL
ncbi:MAG: FAD-binding protein [Gemmatimonadaceae bacterium]|nr:FAD-binding protein [Gemmatimonadaceae bacterium]